jgi:FkbM family methyltransferase
MRVFLDIGAHEGETAAEVMKPEYGFDRIVCFEPSKTCLPKLQAIADPRIEICPFGLAGTDGTADLHDAGTQAASIYGGEGPVETVQLVDAGRWFYENLDGSEFLVVKTNCEGAEVDIIERLLDEELMQSAVLFLITFDIRNYPDQRHREALLRERLRKTGLTNFCFSDDVMIGPSHQQRVAHWLHLFGIDKPNLGASAVRSRYADAFQTYSSKRGSAVMAENAFKERFAYSKWPEPVKKLLRSAKRALGLSRERVA